MERALEILQAFERPPHRYGASEIARRLSMTRNQAFRLLKTLRSHGFVEQAADRSYTIGLRAFEVGQLALERHDVARAARPALQELHELTGETVHLGVLDGTEAVCVDVIESRHLVRLSAQVGRRFPLHVGACPKVLLAYLPDDQREEVIRRGLPAFTRTTVTDPDALREELRDIRRRGYGVSEGDLDEGACAVAAPIRDQSGAVIAAMSIAGPTIRVGRKLRNEHRRLVVQAASRVSAQLGHRLRQLAPAAGAISGDAS